MLALLAEQMGVEAKALRKTVPDRAMASSSGVLAIGFPKYASASNR
jgi:hypothetical protein